MSKDSVTCKVNLNHVIEDLQDLEPKLVRSQLRKALREVGIFWVAKAKEEVPVDHGDLKDSIIAKVSTRKGKRGSDGVPTGSVTVGSGYTQPTKGDGKSPGVYALWVEYGLKTKKYAANPFMRRTFDETSDKAMELFAETFKNRIEEAIKD